jgi:hypothetical protein
VCEEHKKLNRNGMCADCNELAALRECNRCHNLLALPYFYGKKKICIACR